MTQVFSGANSLHGSWEAGNRILCVEHILSTAISSMPIPKSLTDKGEGVIDSNLKPKFHYLAIVKQTSADPKLSMSQALEETWCVDTPSPLTHISQSIQSP